MARSRAPSEKSNSSNTLDDIELLNIHRYPESVSPSVLAAVRNSRIYQKRLEELLKSMPSDRSRGRGRPSAGFFQELDTDDSGATPSTPESGSAASEAQPASGFTGFIKKLFR